MRDAEKVQPMPNKGAIDVLPEVIADLQGRDRIGTEKYGTTLQAHNGRDALLDAYQEQLDCIMYLKQRLIEAENERNILCQVHALLAGKKHPGPENIAKSVDLISQILNQRCVSGAA